MIDGNDKKDYIDRLEFMLDKSIDNEGLLPKLKNALEYIIELYNEKPSIKKSYHGTLKDNFASCLLTR